MELTSENLLAFIQDFKDKLLSEGDADQLAQHFLNQGMQAYCGVASRCAIAQALISAIQAEFAVPRKFVGVTVSHFLSACVITTSAMVETGEQLGRFMNRFDAGVYGSLIDLDDHLGRNRAWNIARHLSGIESERRDEVLVYLGVERP